jgi:predicted DNA-binding transcriptional regulator AlpA
VAKKPIQANRKSGDERGWLRNGELAEYLNVSKMTLWRWKHDPKYDFPAAAKINDMEFNDLDKVDAWMQARIAKQ